MESAIYHGEVCHHRLVPKDHKFRYTMSMMYIDTDELEKVFSSSLFCGKRWFHLLRYRRRDFHGDPSLSVKEAVYKTVHAQSGLALDGPVRVLSHWRFLGFNFNPLSTYYCFDKPGKNLVAVLAEVTNTPWLERKAYVLLPQGDKLDVEFNKDFTVSPFNPVNMRYRWQSSLPNNNLSIQIHSYHEQKLKFYAQLTMKRAELNKKNIHKLIRNISVSAYGVVTAIYFEATKLFVKGVPFLGKNKIQSHRT